MTESTFIEPSPSEALEAFKARVNKKGNNSWKPADKLSLSRHTAETLKKNGLHPRWVSREDDMIGRRLDQGFAFANRETGTPIEGSAEKPTVPGTTPTRHDLVLMVTTAENAEGYRNSQHRKTDEIENTISKRAEVAHKEQFGQDKETYGRTVIE